MNPNDPNQEALPRSAHPQQRGNPYQLSPEEMRVMRECNRESFFQRALPIGTGLGLATYYGVKGGYFRPHGRYGATPKVVVAVIAGYFLGKISYQQRCAEKLMQLPNSRIGEMLRQRRKGVLKETLEPGLGVGMSLSPFPSMDSMEKYSDTEPSQLGDLDTSRPDYNGLDDSHRPSIDNPIYEEEMPPMQKRATTYEELRRQNRDEYQQQRRSPPSYRSSTAPSATSLKRDNEIEERPQRTNIYGDPIL